MRDPRQPAAPPFWVWPAAAAFALVLLVASLPPFLEARDAPRMAPTWMMEAIARFVAEAPAGSPSMRVIAFGDSALGTATLPLAEMNEYAREHEQLDLDFLRLTRPFGLLHHVLREVEAAIETEPDAVMIDTWMLVYGLDRLSQATYQAFEDLPEGGVVEGLGRVVEEPSLIADHQAYLFDVLTGSTAGQVPTEMGGQRGPRRAGGLHCDRAGRQRLLRASARRYPAGTPLEVDPVVRRTLDRFVAIARGRGVAIVFFDLPRAAPIEALPGVLQKRALTRELIRAYVERGDAVYLPYSEKLDEGDTCDYVHYSAAGRDRYLPWFAHQLAALRAQATPR